MVLGISSGSGGGGNRTARGEGDISRRNFFDDQAALLDELYPSPAKAAPKKQIPALGLSMSGSNGTGVKRASDGNGIVGD